MSDFLDLNQFADLQSNLIRADFQIFCEMALAPLGHKPAAHHRIIIRELQALADGLPIGPNGETYDRLMIELPPGAAKSTYASVLFPPWYMARNKRPAVIGASSTGLLAEKFSRKVQEIVRDNPGLLGFNLRTEAAERWQTDEGGEYAAVGIGGNAAGLRASLVTIDDPYKSRVDADSLGSRELSWNWYQSVIEPRLKPGGIVVIITTRWHQDDLCGRLLVSEPERWRRVRIRAQAIAGEEDPLGRAPGEFLWSDDTYGYADVLRRAKERLEKSCAMREWFALYQQEPRPPEGALFMVHRIEIVEPLRDYMPAQPGAFRPDWPARPARKTVRAWDLAGTEASEGRDPDWTVGLRMTDTENRFVTEDVIRVRLSPGKVADLICDTARRDGRGVTIGLPKDPGQAGKAQAEYLAKRLAGYRVIFTPTRGNKAVRATPFASQTESGTVAMVRAPWNAALQEEMRDFPYGAHDDQIDAGADAFNILTGQTRGGGRVVTLD